MKKLCNIVNRGGIYRLITCLTLLGVLLFLACNHGSGSEDKPNGGQDSLEPLTVKLAMIKGEKPSLGVFTFKGDSVTIDKGEVIIVFNQTEAPNKFIFSENFPITLQKGESKRLTISTKKTTKYRDWHQDYTLVCTNLETLKAKIKVHGKDVKDNGTVELDEILNEVKEGNVSIAFSQSDAPAHRFEGLPIKLKAGKEAKFRILTDATSKYEKFFVEVTIIVKPKGDPSLLIPKKITVCEREVKSGKVTIPLKYSTITKDNIKIFFDEEDAPKEVKCEPATLSLNAGEEKALKIYTEATGKYKKCEQTIMVKREEKKELHIDKLTIHRRSATSKSVTIKKETVTKDDVFLSFLEPDAPSEFTMTPESLTLPKNGKGTLTISTAETETYNAWNIEVEVKREKDENDPKDIDDVIATLKNQLTWVDAYVESDIALPGTVTGFTDSNVEWRSEDKEHFNIYTGEVKRDIADVKLEIKATVSWNGNTKTVTFSTTIKRIDKIEERRNYDGGIEKIIVWDFSEEGFLKRSFDGKATHLWEISNVDIKKKELTASLKKKSIKEEAGELLELEDYSKEKEKDMRKQLEPLFGASYIALKKKSVITWQEYKAYFLETGNFSETDDEKLFESLKERTPLLGDYSGTFAEFNALSDAERTKIIKDGLNNIKLGYCIEWNIPKDTADEELISKILEKVTLQVRMDVEKVSQEWKCNYRLDYGIHIIVAYDSNKRWCEQFGFYNNEHKQGERQVSCLFDKISTDEIMIQLDTWKDNNDHPMFRGKCLISQSNSFTLKNTKDESKELQCSVTDVKDGEFTLTTTGSITGTFKMKFRGKALEYWLRW